MQWGLLSQEYWQALNRIWASWKGEPLPVKSCAAGPPLLELYEAERYPLGVQSKKGFSVIKGPFETDCFEGRIGCLLETA